MTAVFFGANRPKAFSRDSAFAGQDPISMGILVRLIRRLNDALGLTSVIVSHDIEEACGIADYIYVVCDGVVVGEGTPEELGQSGSQWVTQFNIVLVQRLKAT